MLLTPTECVYLSLILKYPNDKRRTYFLRKLSGPAYKAGRCIILLSMGIDDIPRYGGDWINIVYHLLDLYEEAYQDPKASLVLKRTGDR